VAAKTSAAKPAAKPPTKGKRRGPKPGTPAVIKNTRVHVQLLFIAESENALSTLKEIMNDKLAETPDRHKAAVEILDRGLGKAVTVTEITADINSSSRSMNVTADLTALPQNDLKQLENLLAKAMVNASDAQQGIIDVTPDSSEVH
jgi:hypothetical protein